MNEKAWTMKITSPQARSDRMKYERVDLLDRTIAFSLRLIKLFRKLERDGVGRIVGNQLLRCGTSVGANLHEAQGAHTKADFNSKIAIAQREALETIYWLKIIKAETSVPVFVEDVLDEASQLVKILSAILVSSKKSQRL